MIGWLKIKSGADYSDVCERTFNSWFGLGLRRVKIKGCVLVKRQWIDDFLQKHEESKNDKVEVDKIVDQISGELNL